MKEPVRQLDIGPSAPIPGSARERMQQQAERMLPGIGTPEVPAKSSPVAKAWGDAASQGGLALALTLRSKGFKWALRVTALVLWFVLPVALSGVLTLLMVAWGGVGVASWVKRVTRPKKALDTCPCGR